MLSPALTGVSRRHLLSTAAILAFAIGFGAGVFGARLLDLPTDVSPRAALAAVDRPGADWTEGALERARGRPLDPGLAVPADDRLAARPGMIDAPQAAPATHMAEREAPAMIDTPQPAAGMHMAEHEVPAPQATAGMRMAEHEVPAVIDAPQATAGMRTAEHEGAFPDGLSRETAFGGEARPANVVLRAPQSSNEQVTVRRGDTLMDILDRAGIAQDEAHAAVRSLQTIYDPRRLRAGQELLIRAEHGPAAAGARRLIGLDLDVDFDHAVRVTRGADGRYATAKVTRPQRRELVHRAGIIDDSLYVSAEHAALPHDVIISLIKLFSWDVDFQRDVRPGDQFETLFEVVALEDDLESVRGGDLLYAALSIDGRLLEGYRFELPGDRVAYFDRSGKSLRKFLMRTPVDGARLSSRFGMRRHPILGYTLMHKGVDFAAPTGTPIYAAGDGRVDVAARNGGYGKYIRIRHTGEYSTAYAHLSRFAKGIQAGRRVRQGQVIGYIGTTGRSTGPHLHYEVLRNGSQINPLQVRQPPDQQLAGADLERFRAEVARIDQLRADPPRGTQLASRGEAGG